MSSSGSGSSDSSIYIFLGILILLVIRRFSRTIRGSKVSMSRTIIYSIYYLAFAGLLIAVSILSGGVSAVDLVLYALVGAIGGYASYVVSNSRIGFWKGADGSIYYKGAIVVYLIYIVGLIARIAIDLAFIGPQAFTFSVSATSPALSSTAIDAGIATDLLLSLGVGLLVGRNLRVMKRYNAIMAGKEEVTDTPPNVPLL
jgi:NADH:ubiquinone oxidoreductase subunit 6 (subunit J)